MSMTLTSTNMALEQVAEPHQGCGIGYAGAAQIYAHEAAQGLGVVDGIFNRLISQAVPLLHEVHAQHAFKSNRWTSAFATLGVVGLDDLH